MTSISLLIKDRNFILLLIGLVLFLNCMPLSVSSPIIILLLGILLGALIISLFAPESFRFLFNLFLIGFSIRVFLSFLFYILSFIFRNNFSPGFLFPNDGFAYSQQGWQIAKFAERGIRITSATFLADPNMKVEQGCSGNITQYDFFVSHIYSIIGKNPLSLFFITCIASSITALLVYMIAKEIFPKNVARASAVFAFFWPSFIMWSTQNLKEPVISMFICILIWTIFYIYRHASPSFLILSLISLWVLFKIGLVYEVIIVCMIILTALFLFLNYLFKNKFIALLIVIPLLLAGFFLFKDKIFEKTIYDINKYKSIFEFLDYSRGVRAYGNLQFFKNADISTFGKLLSFLPIGLIYAIFAPFPWQLGNFMQIIAVPETLLFYVLVPFTIKGMIFAFKKRFNQSVLLFSIIFGILIFLGLVEGNSGTLFRHRSVALYLIFIFTSAGMFLKRGIQADAQTKV